MSTSADDPSHSVERLQPLLTALQQGHRAMFVVCGEHANCLALAQQFLDKFHQHSPVLVSNAQGNTGLHQLLGHECEALIYDGFAGLNPDQLAAASGLVKAGGWLGLVLPDYAQLMREKDRDYPRMCRDADELARCGHHFIHRLWQCLQTHPAVLWLQPAHIARLPQLSGLKPTSTTPFNPTLPTRSQQHAIQAIIAMTAHSTALLMLHADRGRGKSSALGLAAAHLCRAQRVRILLCTPAREQTQIVLQHFSENGSADAPGQLICIAPDTLLLNSPPADLVLVDEAAMLPLQILLAIAQRYPRVVYASTQYGYEGSGRGFALKLQQGLLALTQAREAAPPQVLTLQQAIRWCQHDLLENCINEALLLQADVPDQVRLNSASAPEIYWLTQAELATDATLLHSLFGLLVSAHYQTKPSDLRMLLDHPAVQIAVYQDSSKALLGAIVLLAEGGIEDPDLAQGLIEGRRRPRGHLLPQALTQFSAQADWLRLRTLRVLRIAVLPGLQGQGIGSRLIRAARERAQLQQQDYLCSSFGLSAELLRFWQGNDFSLLRIGYRIDSANACHSAQVALPLCDQAMALVQHTQRRFSLLFQQLQHSHFAALDRHTRARVAEGLSQASADQVYQLQLLPAFCQAYRSFEDVIPELMVFLQLPGVQAEIAQWPPSERDLIAQRLQGCDWVELARAGKWTGKKAAQTHFKALITRLLKTAAPDCATRGLS